jgi:hypothetical protein
MFHQDAQPPGQAARPIYFEPGSTPRHCDRPMQAEAIVIDDDRQFRAWRCPVCAALGRTFIGFFRSPGPVEARALADRRHFHR